MDIREFCNEVLERFLECNPDREAEVQEVKKNNGYIYFGLSVKKLGINIAPIFYLDNMYQRFVDEMITIDEIVEKLTADAKEQEKITIPDLAGMLESEDLAKSLKIRMVNWEKNKERIEERAFVYYPVEGTDLVCLFCLVVEMHDDVMGTMTLHQQAYDMYLKERYTVEELYQEVVLNTEREEIKFTSMEDMLISLRRKMMDDDYDGYDLGSSDMYVLTGNNLSNGASLILSEEGQRCIREELGEQKLLVLPSSIHELLLLPMPTDRDYLYYLNALVYRVNRHNLLEEDFLSDSLYSYDPVSGRLEMITLEGEKKDEEQ